MTRKLTALLVIACALLLARPLPAAWRPVGAMSASAPHGNEITFHRRGAVIPMQQLVQYTDQAPINPLTFEIYPNGNSEREYYEDDGQSFDYRRGEYLKVEVQISATQRGVTVRISKRQGSYRPPARSLVLKIHAQHEEPRQVDLDGRTLSLQTSLTAFKGADKGWFYDPAANIVWIKLPDTGGAVTAKVDD